MSDFDNFDELDAVRDFRSTLAVLEPDADARIRARIVELARSRGLEGASVGDPDVIELEPVVDLRDLPQTRVPATSRRLDDAPAAAVVELPAARQPSAWRPTRLMAAAAAIVIVVLAGTIAFRGSAPQGGDVGTFGEAPTTGSTVVAEPTSLASLANLVRPVPATPLAPGEFLHIRFRSGSLQPDPLNPSDILRSELQTEQWASANNTGKRVEAQAVLFSLGTPPSSSLGLPSQTTNFSAVSTPFAFAFTSTQIDQLPSDAAGLERAINTGVNRSGPVDAFMLRIELLLLGMPNASGQVRAAGFDLLTSQGFVAVGDRTLDTIGARTGSAFELTRDGTTFTVVFDSATGAPIALQQVVAEAGAALAPAAPVGALLTFAVFEASDVVTEVPA
jgi:hypothetical protein